MRGRRDLLGQLARGRPWRVASSVVGRGQPLDEPEAVGLVGVDPARRPQQVERVAGADQAGQRPRRAVLGDEAPLGEDRQERGRPSTAKRRSHIVASTNPPPAVTPLTAAMTAWAARGGTRTGRAGRRWRGRARATGAEPALVVDCSTLASRPAQKPRPAPVMTMPTTSGSADAGLDRAADVGEHLVRERVQRLGSVERDDGDRDPRPRSGRGLPCGRVSRPPAVRGEPSASLGPHGAVGRTG